MKWLLTHYSRLFLLPACLLFFCFSSNTYAACTANYPYSTTLNSYYTTLNSTLDPTKEAACDRVAAFYNATVTVSGNKCVGPSITVDIFTSSSCAVGYTSNGTQCISNTCTGDCPAADTKISDGFTTTSTGSSSCYETSVGAKCAVSHGDLITSTNPDTGITTSWVSSGRYTGGTCSTVDTALSPNLPVSVQVTPVNNPPKSATDCPGGSGFAQINNTAMCLPSGTTIKDTPSTTTSTSGTTSSQTTTVINNNGTSTTTTTTTYRDGNGNITYEGTSTGTGSLNQAGTGTGNDKQLDLGTAPTFDDTLPGEAAFTPKIQSNPTFSTTIFEVAASCPAPITFEVFSQEFTISFQPICDLSTIIRGIILMLSGIVAMRAVVSGGN